MLLSLSPKHYTSHPLSPEFMADCHCMVEKQKSKSKMAADSSCLLLEEQVEAMTVTNSLECQLGTFMDQGVLLTDPHAITTFCLD